MPDDGGVFGNLPRSRPGPRSAKRDLTEPAAERPARREPGASRAPTPRPGSRGGDPVGEVVRLAVGTAETGARIASGITRELLRRLPRP